MAKVSTKNKAVAKESVKESISSQLDKVAGRAGSDTIRLWESYREQAYLWRALALLQMPATITAIIFAVVMYFTADTIVEVPDMPQPGFYSVKKLPDSQFVDMGNQVINLISTYQPAVAEDQFNTARKYLWEPALSAFDQTMMTLELRAIQETTRTQVFFIDDNLLKIERFPDQDYVVVRVPGTRQKLIGNKPLAPEQIVYYVKMTTIPRNVHNKYGIVVTDIQIRKVDLDTLEREDQAGKQKIVQKDRQE